MPDSEQAGQAFLTALSTYVDFRLGERGTPQEAPAQVTGFVKRFEVFLETRPGAKTNRDAFDDLVVKMGKMKETRGPGGPTPDSPEPGG